MKTYSFNYDLHIFDTDCYGVAWHGSYTKWLEMGRVNFFRDIGVDLKVLLDDHDVVFPVIEQHVKFKSPARQGDVLRLTTQVELKAPKMIFSQEIIQLDTEKTVLIARTDVVMVNTAGKLYPRFPEVIHDKLAAINS